MSAPRRKYAVVGIKWEKRTKEGLRYAILRWTDPETGKRRSRKLGFVSSAKAEEVRGDKEAALRLQVALPIDSFTVRVADLLLAYLDGLDKRPISAAYGAGEFNRCEHLRGLLGHLAAAEVTSETLARYLGDRRREPVPKRSPAQPPRRSSLLQELDTLRRAYSAAIETRLYRGPVPNRPRGKLPNDMRPSRRLTEAEVSRLIEAGHRDPEHGPRSGSRRVRGFGWLLQTLAWSGRRPVAVLDLEVDDVSRLFDPSIRRKEQLVRWRRDKGGEGLGLGPVTEPARAALIARAGEVVEGRLWPHLTDSVDVARVLGRVSEAAGVPDVQPYDLRRFGATQILAQCGSKLKVAMEYTGHRRAETLLRYIFAAEGEAEQFAARIGWSPLRAAADDTDDEEEG